MTNPTYTLTTRRLYALVNASVVFLTLVAVFIGFNWKNMPDGLAGFLQMRITMKNALVTAVCLSGGAVSFWIFGLAKPAPGTSSRSEFLKVTAWCTVAASLFLLFPVMSTSGVFTPRIVLYFFPVAITACLCGRLAARRWAQRLACALKGPRDLIIVGSGPRAENLYKRIQDSGDADWQILGFVDSPNGNAIPAEVEQRMLGGLEDLESILMRQPVDEVLIALPAKSCYEQIESAIRTCECAGVEAKYLLDVFGVSLARPRIEAGEESPVVSFKVVQDDARLLVKRGIDILGAAVGLIVFGPMMLLSAAAIKLSSPGPALFVQERYGLRKRRFRMYKFRTMVPDAERLQGALESRNEASGPAFKLRDDPRITPIGHFLRRTSLDEFPQFINVLKGEMSLVGPRPLPTRDVRRFDRAALMRRFSVKPGLTCLWQINGRSDTDFERWIELDLQYIDTWSLSLDLEIIAKTFPTVITGRGAV